MSSRSSQGRPALGRRGHAAAACVIGLLSVAAACGAQDGGLEALVSLLAETEDAGFQADLLKGIEDGLQGRRRVPMPAGWAAAYRKLAASKSEPVREGALRLALVFGDPPALAALRKTLGDPQAQPKRRHDALAALAARNDPKLAAVLIELLEDSAMRGPALRALAGYRHPRTAEAILGGYGKWNDAEKRDALQTLAARPAWALALLAAIERRAITRQDLSAFTARQMLELGDAKVTARVKTVWGRVRERTKDKAALIARYKKMLSPKALKGGGASRGRAVFARTCGACHVLFGEGGRIGPDLTGSNRANLDYVLDNVIDPNGMVGQGYQLNILNLADGRVVTGMIRAETDDALTVQTLNEEVVVPKNEIAKRAVSPVSMMPEGLISTLSDKQIADLILYLRSPRQVPLPKKR